MIIEEDSSHCHCIDCGKLFNPDQHFRICSNCGGLIDFCDGRCKYPETEAHFKGLGISWEKYGERAS